MFVRVWSGAVRRYRLGRTVVALGLASLLTDLSSEMIYPLLPVFLAGTLGAGAVALGLIEGAAETTAAILKIVSGLVTDRTGRRKPLILAGYSIAGFARPLIGLAQSWPVVLLLRVTDRIGKGIRTSPRDALLADIAPPESRGTVYGFHRAMDHMGAVLGPLAATALLAFLPIRSVILLAAIPAALVIVVLLFGVKEEPRRSSGPPRPLRFADLSLLGTPFRRFLLAVGLFTLGRSADAFLLLRLAETGTAIAGIAGLWSLHHVVRVVATWTGGRLADRFDRRLMLLAGWTVYAAVYLSFAQFETGGARIAIFLLYGVYYGLSEPAQRAIVADLVPERLRGTAFGFFHGVEAVAAFPASVVFGLLYTHLGHGAAFLYGAALAGAAALLLARVPRTVSSRP